MELRTQIEWLKKITVHRKGVLTYKVFFYGIIISLYLVLIPWMYNTIGEPYQTTLETNELLKEHAIDEGIEAEDERPLPSPYLPNPWAFVGFILVFTFNCLLHLFAQWFVWFDAWCNFVPVTGAIEKGDIVLVEPVEHRGKTELCEVILDDAFQEDFIFKFHRLKYEITDENEVIPLNYMTEEPLHKYMQSQGLEDDEDIRVQSATFGLNKFHLPRPSFLTIYKQQCLRPIVIFQLFCALLWALDTYIKYTLFSIMSIFGFEAASVFQRHKNLNVLRGMSNPSYKVKVKRKFKWIECETEDILPGELISIKFNTDEAFKAILPCDCLLLEGTAVVNEATLTGESVPQMKEGVNPTLGEENLDIEDKHRIHVLYAGTTLISINNVGGQTPDDGCLCYVLRTGFASSQGKLMRMIEFSKDEISGDSKETLGALLVLLAFALVAAYYVLTDGLEKGERTTYEIVIKCILIITSVVPASFPMQMALAVNTALMALLKKGVFCTEPFRVPAAGKVKYCLFDKTGTITTDELIPAGIVNNNAGHELEDMKNASEICSIIVGGCHTLLNVDGETIGDPIETAALRGIKWRWDDKAQTARVGNWEKRSKKLKDMQGQYTKMIEDTKTKEETKVQQKEKIDKLSSAISKEKSVSDRSKLSVTIEYRYHFSSKLQRMSTICTTTGVRGKGKRDYIALVKGSPEAIGRLCSDLPEWYEEKYSELAESGRRVLSLAYKFMGGGIKSAPNREDVECDLTFAGFCAFECKTRGDSGPVMSALINSGHECLMLTGDAPLTSVHVARETHMIDEKKIPLLLCPREGTNNSLEWRPMYFRDRSMKAIPFKIEDLEHLSTEFEFVATEDSLRIDDDLWDNLLEVLKKVKVFSRMSPQGKAEIVDKLKQENAILYIGDGGNDVGALKEADVGIALLSGFGNANVEKVEETGDKDVWSVLEGRNKQITKRAREKQKGERERMGRKKRELQGKQTEWLQEAVEERAKKGETGVMSHLYSFWDVFEKHKQELQKEQKDAKKKHGTGFAAGAAKWAETMGEEGDGEEGDLPMVRLGDASISAPFTSRAPSIQAVIDIVRQGRCTLLSTLQQQQIMMLECIISAYTLSALSLQGSRNSEIQLMSTGVLLMTASLAFTYSTPVETIDKVRPLSSLFHPAIFVSIMGQAFIHIAVMVIGVNMAKEHMGEEQLKEVNKFFRTLDRKLLADEEGAIDEEIDPYEQLKALFSTPFMPNLLNSVVFLIRSSEEVAVLLVNYKGRPWMKGFTENHPLFLSLVLMVAGVACAAWGIFPQLNTMLQLEPFPDDEFRWQVMALVFSSLVGTFLWDRLCLLIFAPEIFQKYWVNIKTTSFSDLAPLLSTIAKTVIVITILSTGNLILYGFAFYGYRKYYVPWTQREQ